MSDPGSPRHDGQDSAGSAQPDVRQRVASAIEERGALLIGDTAGLFPREGLDPAACTRIATALVQLARVAVRDGRVDPRSGLVAELSRFAIARSFPAERLFAMMYLVERAVLDDLAADAALGATTDAWPLVAQLVRRGSFDTLAAVVDRGRIESTAAVTDPLTTLYSRAVFDVVLAKEVDRANRYGDILSLLLFDVDGLAAINAAHGQGVGDRLLERLGVLLRTHFRQHDWVARHGGDSMAVLLLRTAPDAAAHLAEQVCRSVSDRLGSIDHRTGAALRASVSAAVLNVRGTAGTLIDPDRLMADAEAALARARRAGGGRVERVDGYSGARTVT